MWLGSKAFHERSIEFVQLRFRCVVVREPSGALHLANDWVESAVGVLWRAEVPKARVRLSRKAFQERSGQSRLADPRFTGEQHHLPLAALCFRPAAQQQFEFFFPSYKLREPARVESIKTAFDRSRSQGSPCPHRPCDALEVPCPKVLKLEQIAHEPPGTFGNHDPVRLRKAL